jgi:catechol 2,3-dioxygenase-like lactoylglutathione lyase family enzyme
MISHMSLGISEVAKSATFYDAIMEPLGYSRMADTKPGEIAYGPPGAALFWLYEMPAASQLASTGTHVAFRATSRDSFHQAAEAARELGVTFTREPGPHPDIAADYYGAVFLDPDGHKLEIVVEAA